MPDAIRQRPYRPGALAVRLCAMLLAVLVLALPAGAQSPNAEASATLEAARPVLTGIETALQKPDLPDAELSRLRAEVDPVADRVRAVIEAVQPRLDAARARLEQLGPKPADGAPAESPEVQRDREERSRLLAETDEIQKRGRALLVEAEQIVTTIADRRRASFTQRLFARSQSVLDPELWLSALDSLPQDLRAIRDLGADWGRRFADRYAEGRLWLLLIAFVAAGVLIAIKQRLHPQLASRPAEATDVTPLSRAAVAGFRVVFGTMPVAIACFILYAALDAIYLLPPRVGPVIHAVVTAVAFFAFARALGDAVLAPSKLQWRLVRVDDPTAQRLMRLIWAGSAIILVARISEALLAAVAAALPLTVLVRAILAAAFALALVGTLRALAQRPDQSAEDCLGPYVPSESKVAAPLRLGGWIASIAILGGVLFGYVSLASFIMAQIVWIATLAAVLVLLSALVDASLGASTAENARIALALQSMVGVRRRSLEQLSVLAAGAIRVVLIAVGLLLALAPWGIESGDLWGSVRAVFFGFKIGDYTISLSAILLAAFLFGAGLAVTRALQRWLERRFLPATDLDAGLRNSIQTVAGYVGVILAAAIAFAQLGLSFDKLTIVAGALSVGIGFGLQSIVSNFVSGLILLGERPIRVGDRILVGSDEGVVKRINVRATEIETGDRAVLIVPNSTLITGVVRNRVRNDRTARVVVTLVMPRGTDAAWVRETLLSVAHGHKDVLRHPEPVVRLKKIGEATLEFDLIVIVDEIDIVARVASDLNFAAFERLGIGEVPDAPDPEPQPDPQPDASVPPAAPRDEAQAMLAPKS